MSFKFLNQKILAKNLGLPTPRSPSQFGGTDKHNYGTKITRKTLRKVFQIYSQIALEFILTTFTELSAEVEKF